jgi:hypothetical protein
MGVHVVLEGSAIDNYDLYPEALEIHEKLVRAGRCAECNAAADRAKLPEQRSEKVSDELPLARTQ